jgi:outer membrane beta-barrel protein
MAGRRWIFLLRIACALILIPGLSACAVLRPDEPEPYRSDRPVIEPELERREITEADIDSEDFEVGGFVGLMNVEDFGTNLVYGVRAAYHITEDFFAEAALGRTDTDQTSYEDLSGGARLLTDDERQLTYYNLSLGWNALPGEVFIGRGHAFNSALYLIGGAGNTDFGGDNHFTVNVGAGYRLLLTDWAALHVDVRDHIFESDLLGDDEYKHNLEAHTGLRCSSEGGSNHEATLQTDPDRPHAGNAGAAGGGRGDVRRGP